MQICPDSLAMQGFEVLRATYFTLGSESFLHNLKTINIYQLISILIGWLLEDDKKQGNKDDTQ